MINTIKIDTYKAVLGDGTIMRITENSSISCVALSGYDAILDHHVDWCFLQNAQNIMRENGQYVFELLADSGDLLTVCPGDKLSDVIRHEWQRRQRMAQANIM